MEVILSQATNGLEAVALARSKSLVRTSQTSSTINRDIGTIKARYNENQRELGK